MESGTGCYIGFQNLRIERDYHRRLKRMMRRMSYEPKVGNRQLLESGDLRPPGRHPLTYHHRHQHNNHTSKLSHHRLVK